MLDSYQKEIAKLLNANAYRHRLFKVFSDFCELSAIAISNSIYTNEKRESRYLDIIRQYEPEEVNRFPIMLGLLVQSLESKITDVLGNLYMSLELGSDRAGQFFTPWEVSYCMAKMTLSDAMELLKTKDFITIHEPACGAGCMVLAIAQGFTDDHINYQEAMHVTAIDIDPLCVYMAFIQFSILGIPAIVYQGDTLKYEFYDTWKTPLHFIGNWNYRLLNQKESTAEIKTAPLAHAMEPIPITPCERAQLSMF